MSQRSSEVLPMTLTEILVLLFFILALALAWRMYRYQNIPDEAVEAADRWVASGGELPDDWSEALACSAERAPRDDGRTCVEVLDSMETSAAELAQALGIDTTQVTSEQLLDSIRDQIELAKEVAKDAIADFGQDSSIVEDLSLPELVNVLRGRGSDPPCWWQFVEGDRDIIFVLDVVLRADDITVSPSWPDFYADEATEVTNLVQLSRAGRISYPEFRRLALPVLRWGQQQNPQCRHFVVIHDSVQGDNAKEDFKRGMLTVEDYFYKYLAN